MTTGRRSAYNRIKDLQGMIYGFELAQQSNLSIDAIDKLINEYDNNLNSSVDVWLNKFSTNANCESIINKEKDIHKRTEMMYCYERVKLYNDIRYLGGIITGLNHAKRMVKYNAINQLNQLVLKIKDSLSTSEKEWNRLYANMRTTNAYEL